MGAAAATGAAWRRVLAVRRAGMMAPAARARASRSACFRAFFSRSKRRRSSWRAASRSASRSWRIARPAARRWSRAARRASVLSLRSWACWSVTPGGDVSNNASPSAVVEGGACSTPSGAPNFSWAVGARAKCKARRSGTSSRATSRHVAFSRNITPASSDLLSEWNTRSSMGSVGSRPYKSSRTCSGVNQPSSGKAWRCSQASAA